MKSRLGMRRGAAICIRCRRTRSPKNKVADCSPSVAREESIMFGKDVEESNPPKRGKMQSLFDHDSMLGRFDFGGMDTTYHDHHTAWRRCRPAAERRGAGA